MSFLLLKALHLIAMICWFAGLFYLPRLFVYHAMAITEEGMDSAACQRFHTMERKLYRGIMTPAMIATLLFGLWMIAQNPTYLSMPWMQVKLSLVSILVIYHLLCGSALKAFQRGKQQRNHVYFRWFNEIPVLFLIAIICLAIFKPF